ncbi:hypothetical protein TYRP_020453 [Tyrophagus putrescentiae]|nr:hypothetical protein TYRP_020453 [Tyrophagus putrescentiae]
MALQEQQPPRPPQQEQNQRKSKRGKSNEDDYDNRSTAVSKKLLFDAEIGRWIGRLASLFFTISRLLFLQVDIENVADGVCALTELKRAAGEGASKRFGIAVRSKVCFQT